MPPTDKPDTKPNDRGLLDGATDFAQAAAHTFIQTPIDGITQLYNKTTNHNLKPVEIISAPKENNNWTLAGDTVATVGQFVIASKGLRAGCSSLGLVNPNAPTKLWETVASGTAVDFLHGRPKRKKLRLVENPQCFDISRHLCRNGKDVRAVCRCRSGPQSRSSRHR
ncbi:MAG: hypothetical protein U0103_12005 [Candidatus Obscuribacterales bacterium]